MALIQLIADNGYLVAALLGGGLVMGFIAGLLGVGGGAVLVPVLYEVFRSVGVGEDICLHLSIGTSLLVMVPTSLRSFYAHKKQGSVDLQVLRTLAVPVVIGVCIGIFAAKYSDPYTLKLIWVVCLTLLALRMVFAPDHWRLGSAVPLGYGMRIFGVLVGSLSTIMSIGGGAFTSTMMTLYGRPILQAVGTSSGIGPLIAVPGALGFAWVGYGAAGLPFGSVGYVSLVGAVVVIPASVLAAPWGAKVAHGIPKRTLELIFASCLGLISLRFFLSL
ncbi:MAG: sulfite exporter TauE/SafE family protein [Rhodospirillales bacterium]|nr:sulfite exporter TauE/SafE family protein [Rhodospirillales bacterium]